MIKIYSNLGNFYPFSFEYCGKSNDKQTFSIKAKQT